MARRACSCLVLFFPLPTMFSQPGLMQLLCTVLSLFLRGDLELSFGFCVFPGVRKGIEPFFFFLKVLAETQAKSVRLDHGFESL